METIAGGILGLLIVGSVVQLIEAIKGEKFWPDTGAELRKEIEESKKEGEEVAQGYIPPRIFEAFCECPKCGTFGVPFIEIRNDVSVYRTCQAESCAFRWWQWRS